eukprot:7194623-Karenia_brevis.AAC.1
MKHFENNAAIPSDSDDAENEPMANFPDSIGDEEAESVEENKPHDTFPVVTSVPCGCVPNFGALHDFLGLPSNVNKRSAEGRYANEYLERTKDTCIDVACIQSQDIYVHADEDWGGSWRCWSAGE